MNQQSNPEEIDILQFFAAFGQMFSKLFKGIKNLFVKLFYFFVDSLLYLKKNILYISIGIILGLAFSFVSKKRVNTYYAKAMVRTNYDAQLSLQGKVSVMNDLIEKKKVGRLARFLQIDSIKASHLRGFEIKPVMDDALMLEDYENFLKTKDTVVYKFFVFDDFKKSYKNNPQLNNYWRIRVFADTPTVFANFNKTFKDLFKNETAINQRKENYLSALKISRNKILQSIKEIDSLRNLYNTVLLENAKKSNSSGGVIVNSNKSQGPEAIYNLFGIRQSMLKNLENINTKLNKYNDAIIMLNNFPDYGVKEQHIIKNNHIKYALYGFLLTFIILLLKDFYGFLSHYEKQKKSKQIN